MERDTLLDNLTTQLFLVQEKMKKYVDRKRTNKEFNVGDWVFLKIRLYRQATIAEKRNEKLSPKFFDPYQVEDRVGKVACRLKLPANATIHPVFHVSLLK